MLVKTSLLTSVMLLCYLVFFGQPAFPYEHEWKLADSLMNKKNLPKSALEEVNKIYIAAKKDKQEAQWVRAIIYKNHLQEIDERDINQSLRDLEEEISMAPPRVVSLLKSVEAEELFQYLQGHRYQLGNRTTILADTSNDISTWTISRFDDRISKLYVSSIANADLLKKTPLENFNPVLTAGNARDLRPTLYDLLTWRALDYFRLDYDVSSGNDLLKRNAYLFSEALFFMHVAFDSKDSLSYGLITLKLYQELLRFHAKDIPLNAWIDADISRIQFVYQYSNLLDKDSLYLNALGRITRQYPSLSASTQSWYLQAKWWADQASTFEPLTDTTHRYDYLKAIAFCDQAVKYPDSSEGKSNAVDLLKEIKRKHFNLTTEAVNIPEHPIRVLVVYKNINHLFGRIVKMDKETGKLLAKTDPAAMYWQRLANMPVFKTFQQSIPDTKDCQQHAVEIKVDRLSAGQYVLLTSSDTAFNEKSMMSAVAFYCSSISYVRNRFDYFVLDRDSGHPLKGVKIKTFIRKNNENEYPVLPSDSYLSDINGHFKLAFNERREDVNSIRLEFSTVRDFFTSDQYDYYYRHGKTNDDDDVKAGDRQEYEDDHLKDNLYTDRSIYRPGQIVFFKGILVTRDFKTRKYKPVTGEKATIFLKDVNDQTIDSVFLTSNDFGSIHGSFRLPQNLLNGKFKLYDGNTLEDKEFSVEEYKRPTFAVELDAVKNAYSIGDTIRVNGSAIANAGNSVGDAKLSWNVVRESRIPYPWIFRNYPSRSSRQIAHGEAKTDAEGKFTIIFPALPDPSLKKEAGAVYTYQIETTISDINGETRSATIAVSASNHSFEIISSLDLQTRTCPDSLQQIPVTTKNAAGIFVPEKLSISLSPLENPSRLIRKRYWQEPDEFVMSEPEYISSFPNDEYRNELDMKSWHRRSAILEKSDSTHLNGFVSLDKNLLKSLKPGWYVLEFKATDKGQLISDKRYIELVKDSGKSGLYSYDIIPEEDVLTEPGSPIKISTGSDAANLFVIRSKEKLADSLTDFSFYSLNQETKQFNIEITESDRGGFALNDVFVKNNRWYTSEHNIRVPWTNKELQISYLSWNDKTLPGSKQQWKIKISGNKKDKAAAEILTSVYDASLDQVAPQSWSIPDLYPLFSRQNEWSRGLDNFNFGKTSSLYATYYESSVPGKYHQQYDQLLVFPSGNRIYNLLAGRMNSVVVNYEGENKSDMVVAGYGALKSKNQL
ncbi:MAG TPA: MG2 domain-containing protein, partial [Puia sp.]